MFLALAYRRGRGGVSQDGDQINETSTIKWWVGLSRVALSSNEPSRPPKGVGNITRQLDEFLTTAEDIQNITYALHLVEANEKALEAYWNQQKANDPTNPIYARQFSDVRYGLVDSILSAQLVLLATAITYYYDPADAIKPGFTKLAGEFKKVCPDYKTKYDPHLPELHTMEIFMDIRNRIAHRTQVQNYSFIQLSEPPVKVLERSVIVRPYRAQDLVFVKGRSESKDDFLKRVKESSEKIGLATREFPGLRQTSFGELLIDDTINCVKDYDSRVANPNAPMTRKKMVFQ